MKQELDRLVGRLALVGAITLVIAGLAMVGVLLRPQWRAQFTELLASPVVYRAGQTIDVPTEVYRSSPFTLMYFARESCGACQEAAPVVADAIRILRESLAQVRPVLLLTGNEPSAGHEVRLGLSQANIVALPVEAQQLLRLRAVPTLLVVNRAGRILMVTESVRGLKDGDLAARVRNAVGSK